MFKATSILYRNTHQPVNRFSGVLYAVQPLRSMLGSRARLVQKRNLSLGSVAKSVRGYGTIINILGGAYIGGLVVCLGLLYVLYQDANERQFIPFELSFQDQITAVKAINKDDALKSPRYAVKHYRRLLIELARKEDPTLVFDENLPENKYKAPLLDSQVLVNKKSQNFSNFYIDIVLRYAKALLAKGDLELSVQVLEKVVLNDDIFFRLGDAERLSQCSRLLAKISPNLSDKEMLLDRSIRMIRSTFSLILVDENHLLQPNSRITDELIYNLNDLAFAYARESKRTKKPQPLLSQALNIYLANLKTLQGIQADLDTGRKSQANYPLFNCNEENVSMLINETRGHISEIMWCKGYRQNAISWGEEVVDDIYYLNSSSKRANIIVSSVLENLQAMYKTLGNTKSYQRCTKLLDHLTSFEASLNSWYENFISRFCKIVYNRGPLGVIEKAILERFGPPQRLPEIEEFEDEDSE